MSKFPPYQKCAATAYITLQISAFKSWLIFYKVVYVLGRAYSFYGMLNDDLGIL